MAKISSIVMALLSIFTLPIVILNSFSGIVGGIWLAILGEWYLLLGGLMVIFFGHILISLLLSLLAIFIVPANWAFNRRHNVLGTLLTLPAILWTYSLLAFWCTVCFAASASTTHGSYLIPTLLWAYVISTCPWAYLARIDARTDPSAPAIMTTFAAQVGCITIMIQSLLASRLPDARAVYWDLRIPLFFAFVFQVIITVTRVIEERRCRWR